MINNKQGKRTPVFFYTCSLKTFIQTLKPNRFYIIE